MKKRRSKKIKFLLLKGIYSICFLTILTIVWAFPLKPIQPPAIEVGGGSLMLPITANNVTYEDSIIGNGTGWGVYQGRSDFSDTVIDTRTYRIRNSGEEPLQITGISIQNFGGIDSLGGNTFFSIVKNPDNVVAPGEHTEFRLGFSRINLGVVVAEIKISSNDPDIPDFRFYISANSQYCPECDNERHTGLLCDKCAEQFAQDSYPACDVCVEPNMVDDCTRCRFPAADYSTFCTTCLNPLRSPPRCLF